MYQIYPWSFQDSNGNGIGDFPGIITRLDYLNDGTADSPGIDAIWLSPICPSPMVDFRYNEADVFSVARRFGTLSDFDRGQNNGGTYISSGGEPRARAINLSSITETSQTLDVPVRFPSAPFL